jgi:hypothetical protein
MLEAARRALCEVGILRNDERMPPFSVRMSGNLVFLVYPGGDQFYAVKVGTQTDLRLEHEGLVVGHGLFPFGVPKALALSRHRAFPTLVMEGIPYKPLGAGQLQTFDPFLADRIAHFFATCRKALSADVSIQASKRIVAANRALDCPIPETEWARYCAGVASEADRLPPVRQHGDFYVHNLGVYRDALIVLDWEEFGLESLPGLDVAILLLSLNHFSTRQIWDRTQTGGSHAWILDAGCRGCDVPSATLFRLMPAYIALSARVKHDLGYGQEFTDRARRALPEAIEVARRAGMAESMVGTP